jgi:hypothetical protein
MRVVSTLRQSIIVIAAFAAAFLASVTGMAAASEAATDPWLIRPDGFGLFPNYQVTYADASALYPDLTVTEETGDPGRVWRDHWVRGEMDEKYFVYRKDGVELFRAKCPCRWDGKSKSWVVLEERDHHRITPTVMDPRFHTARGIHIGSTVRDLRRAYPKMGPLYGVRRGRWIDDTDIEIVCYGENGPPRPDTIDWISFYVKPAPGKKTAGDYLHTKVTKFEETGDFTLAIDPKAVIVAIGYGTCLLGSP